MTEAMLAARLAEAEKALMAIASDGWLYFGAEGMSEAQKLCHDYGVKYLLCQDCQMIHDPLSEYDHNPRYGRTSTSNSLGAKE